MKIAELFSQTEDAYERVQAQQYAYEQAVALHSDTVQDAKAALQAAVDAANAARTDAIASAQASYLATVKDTEAARDKTSDELAASQAKLEELRGQLNAVLGTEKTNPRATVLTG